jgi:DNA invertase Pin-like site-specific DNA recombinase
MVPQKAIAYLRFSSEGQKDGSSLERQTRTIDAYILRQGLNLVETFIDEGFSASKGRHVTHGKLGTILADVDAGKYRGFALVVEKMDRFSRLGIEESFMLSRRLAHGGVELHLAEPNRLAGSMEDVPTVIADVLDNSAAKKYTDNLKINIRGGIRRIQDQAAANGRVMRSVVPWWLEVVGRRTVGAKDPGKIVPIPEKVALVREVFRLAALGYGVTNIARELNGSLGGRSLSWLSRTLMDRAVLGEHRPVGRDPIPNYFPAIITQTEFNAAREQIARKRPNGKYILGKGARHPGNNLFTGLLFDVTTEPACPLNFQGVKRHSYLMSAWRVGRKQNRLSYKNFETAFLGFLTDLDWRAVAGESESDEVKSLQGELETVLTELDRSRFKIAGMQKLIDEGLFSKSLFESLDAEKVRAIEYQGRKESLAVAVATAQTTAEALYSPEVLIEAIRSGSPELRLKLKSEIAKRISRVDFDFDFDSTTLDGILATFEPDGRGRFGIAIFPPNRSEERTEPVARVQFANGAERLIVFDGEWALLLWVKP